MKPVSMPEEEREIQEIARLGMRIQTFRSAFGELRLFSRLCDWDSCSASTVRMSPCRHGRCQTRRVRGQGAAAAPARRP